MDKKSRIDRLEEELREAWQRSQPPPVPEQWREDVLQAIDSAARPEKNHFMQRALLWSGAVAACAAGATLLMVPSGNLQFTRELVRLVMLDPAGFLRNLPTGF